MSSRPSPRFTQGRLLTVITVVAALGGGGFLLAGAANGDDGHVLLDVEPAVADAAPSTVPPLSSPTASGLNDAGNTGRSNVAGSGLSPMAELLGPRDSAIPEEITPRPRPVGLQIDSIDVARYPIRAIGLEDDGQLEIPDETEIGWYRYGATAGRPGATVLAAHVSWNRTAGPFARLGSVEPGARIEVSLDDGSLRHYEVIERAIYGKLELPRDRIWRNTGPETLVLITCGGDFNPEVRRYADNIVIYAVPVA
jgi:hypothetical protein